MFLQHWKPLQVKKIRKMVFSLGRLTVQILPKHIRHFIQWSDERA